MNEPDDVLTQERGCESPLILGTLDPSQGSSRDPGATGSTRGMSLTSVVCVEAAAPTGPARDSVRTESAILPSVALAHPH